LNDLTSGNNFAALSQLETTNMQQLLWYGDRGSRLPGGFCNADRHITFRLSKVSRNIPLVTTDRVPA